MNVEQRIIQISPILESLGTFSREERHKWIMDLCRDVFRVAYQEGQEMGVFGILQIDHRMKENGITPEKVES